MSIGNLELLVRAIRFARSTGAAEDCLEICHSFSICQQTAHVFVEPERLTTAEGHEVGRTIPRHLGQVMEFITNSGDRSADDGLEASSVSEEIPQAPKRRTLSRAVKNIPNTSDAVKATKRVP